MFEHDLNFFLTYERMLQSKKNIGPSYTEVRTLFRKRSLIFLSSWLCFLLNCTHSQENKFKKTKDIVSNYMYIKIVWTFSHEILWLTFTITISMEISSIANNLYFCILCVFRKYANFLKHFPSNLSTSVYWIFLSLTYIRSF